MVLAEAVWSHNQLVYKLMISLFNWGRGLLVPFGWNICRLFVVCWWYFIIFSISNATSMQVDCFLLILLWMGHATKSYDIYSRGNWKGDYLVLPAMILGIGILGYVKEVKYLAIYLQSCKGLRVNVDFNCTKFVCASVGILNRFGYLSEDILYHIILMECLPNSLCVLGKHRHKLGVAFSAVVRHSLGCHDTH